MEEGKRVGRERWKFRRGGREKWKKEREEERK